MIKTDRVLPQYGHLPEAELALYSNPGGGMALLAVDRGGELQYVATVNLQPYGSRPLEDNEVWLKGWGENAGVPEALSIAGIVTLTGETMQAGLARAQLALVQSDIVTLWRDYQNDRERGR